MKNKLMIIDDEEFICSSLTYNLEDEYKVFSTTKPNEGVKEILKEEIDIVLLDLRLESKNGLEILDKIKKKRAATIVIIMTAYGSIETSIEAIKKGAFTYLIKPLNLDELKLNIKQALKFKELNDKVEYLSKKLENKYSYEGIIGKSHKIQEIFSVIAKIKDINLGVLITGESGTGKGLLAEAIHFSSKRRNSKFVEINCAAIPEGLLEEEFFGHKKGCFTNAISNKEGKLKYADKGTLFLDEIGDMSPSLQSKLLKVLEDKKFTPLGENEEIDIDVRIIVATNKNLRKLVQDGKFRKDLYFRINPIEINIPPLRERKIDLPLLFKHFIKKYNGEMNKNIKGLSKEAEAILIEYDYPGNIRELSNVLEYSCLLSTNEKINVDSLPPQIKNLFLEKSDLNKFENLPSKETEENEIDKLSKLTLKEAEKILIKRCLERNKGRRNISAKSLGISEKGLRNKIKTYKL